MKLSKLKVKAFKRVKLAELSLANVNILVGTNGSGKSSIIQSIHLACCVIRQAERVEGKGKTSTVAIEDLDYLPSNLYKMLGHKTDWGNKAGTPSSEVTLTFKQDEKEAVASCELRSARNAGISITGSIPPDVTDQLRKKQKFFSAYIPGISGIPNKEEKRSQKVVLKACSYGDSNVILRNVLLLLQQKDPENIAMIESWISEIAEPMKIHVTHNDATDLAIACSIKVGNDSRPLELIGTGYLQLIQVFSYILLFDPRILLIDEPDIHLHPTVQEKLIRVLGKVAEERNLRILLTTHSPFVVRGAPADAMVYWVNAGNIESNDRKSVELALGWGAFGKKVIIVSEDSDLALLKKLILQWPDLERVVTFLPGAGYSNITTPTQAAELSEALGGKFKILVHRDRDSLTDDEVATLSAPYQAKGIGIWFTDQSDIESYFCQTAFISSFLGCSEEEASGYVSEVLAKQAIPIADQFKKQRSAHNQELHSEGGGPSNDDVWKGFQGRSLKGAKGKFVFNQLKNIIPNQAFREESSLGQDLDIELAPSLRQIVVQLSQ